MSAVGAGYLGCQFFYAEDLFVGEAGFLVEVVYFVGFVEVYRRGQDTLFLQVEEVGGTGNRRIGGQVGHDAQIPDKVKGRFDITTGLAGQAE